jgi:predicted thioesterase
VRFEVTDADTAAVVGSGDVPVLGTPRLIAWMEAATVAAAQSLVTAGETTVGIAVRIEHLRPTAVGGSVEVTATLLTPSAGRRLTFEVSAVDGHGERVAGGHIDRVIVERELFLRATQRPLSHP